MSSATISTPKINRPNLVAVGTIVWLSSELMFFAALFAMYFTTRAVQGPLEWLKSTEMLNIQFASINTTVLVLSSVTCQFGVFAAERFQFKRTSSIFKFAKWGMMEWFVLTFLMGAFFVGGQAYEYLKLVHEGLTISSRAYGSVFYLTTGFHGLHVTGGLIALDQNPDQRAALIADPSLLPHAAQEIVRYISPVMHMRRTATCDVQMGGKTIKAGDKVVMWYPSGNRDDSVFDAPNSFDITRTAPKAGSPGTPGRHLGFGFGQHVCLGQRLAELQLKVAFETLFERLPNLRPVGEPRRLRSNFINGIKSLMVDF